MIRISTLGSTLMRVNDSSRTYVSDQGPASGIVRYNTNSQQFEVFDGSAWQVFYQDISLEFSPQMYDLIDWIEKKRREELELDRLCAEHPNLADARQEFEVLRRLVADPKPRVKDNF